MSPVFCGDSVCAGRGVVFLLTPGDSGISEPCPDCLAALATALEVAEPVARLRDLHRAVLDRVARAAVPS